MDSFVFLRVGNRVYPGINKRHLLLLSVYAIPVRFILLVIQVVTWVWPDDIRSIVRFFFCVYFMVRLLFFLRVYFNVNCFAFALVPGMRQEGNGSHHVVEVIRQVYFPRTGKVL